MAKKSFPRHYILHIIATVALFAIVITGIVTTLLAMRGTDTDSRSKADSLDDQYVKRVGTKFYLGGKPFVFVGFNLFDAGNSSFPDQGKKGYSCPRDSGWWTNIYSETDLDTAFRYAKENAGASVIRFWAFQRYTNGATDWTGIDKAIRVARKNGMKVIPVLEDGPGYCTYPDPAGNAKWKYQGDTWYTQGYKVRQGNNTLTYPEYVKAIVTRYKDDPAVFGWMMMNEADTSLKVNGQSSLVGFASDIGTLIKSIDKNHLVTVGTQSNGASGATGKDFLDVYGLSVVDFTEVHDWPYWGGDTVAMPGSPDGTSLPNPDSADCTKTYQAKLGCSVAMSVLKLNKPILMGEAGISARTDAERSRRATLMDAKMNAFFKDGGAGYLVWQLNKVVDSEAYDVQITTNDPLFGVMKKYAATILPTNAPVPTISATAIPVITAKPTTPPVTVTPIPTIKPTSLPTVAPTVKPTVTPAPIVVVPGPVLTGTAIQAELFPRDGINARTVTDTNAVGKQALEILKNFTVKSTFRGPVKKLIVRAKSNYCAGYGHINVKINGNYVMDVNIASSSYKDFVSGDISYLSLKAATYPIEIIYNTAYSTNTCTRSVVIDQITLQ